MSVPESVRYRNSNMFAGTPPFSYPSTDDHTPNPYSHWHPPRTPRHGMHYRELHCQIPLSSSKSHRRSRSRRRSRSPNVQEPIMRLTDVVPALFSSPKIDHKHIQQRNDVPNPRRCQSLPRRSSSSPEHSVFDMNLSEVVPAPSSSLKLDPQSVQNADKYPGLARSNVQDIKSTAAVDEGVSSAFRPSIGGL